MSRPFRALLWKEALEVSRHAAPVFLLLALFFYGSVRPSFGRVMVDPDPARHFGWYGMLTALAASIIGFWQTWRESKPDTWGFAVHRPVTRAEVFAAKAIV